MIGRMRAVWELARLSWTTDRGRLLVALALMLAEATALPLAAPVIRELVDAALARDAVGAARAGVLVAVLAVTGLTGGHFAHVVYFELSDRTFLQLDRELIELSNGSVTLAHHERAEYTDRIAVLRQEFNRASNASMGALLSSVSLAVAMVVTGVVLALLNPLLLLLPLAAIPPLVLGQRAEAVLAAARRRAAGAARGARHMFELAKDPATAKELRVLGLQQQVRERHELRWEAWSRTLDAAEVRAALLRIAGQLVFATAYVAGTLLIVREAVVGVRSVGDVVLAIVLAARVNTQVIAAFDVLQELQRVAETMSELAWVRRLVTPPPTAGGDAVVPDRLTDGIRLRGLGFRYPGTDAPVVRDVDAHLPAGTTVAIVGENGAGKTSLVKLLCGLYGPSSGAIEVDGVDLARFDVRRWRERISASFQDFSRFELFARQVVGVGDLPLVDDETAVATAIERAKAADMVAGLEHGLGTELGHSLPDGVELSGGQWQKLALGRAMMRAGPLLLVLDEPTAALDAQAENELFERYAASARRAAARIGAVTILVSHRFSTVRMADLILVIADGRIAERGSHRELMAANGIYAGLYGIQAGQYR